jgi:hypothetical protein
VWEVTNRSGLWLFGIFGDKSDEVAGGWTELLKVERCNLSKHNRVCSVNLVICILRKTVEDHVGGSSAVR